MIPILELISYIIQFIAFKFSAVIKANPDVIVKLTPVPFISIVIYICLDISIHFSVDLGESRVLLTKLK